MEKLVSERFRNSCSNDFLLAFYNQLWSPDGKKILYFVEKGDNKDQIWTMNFDGGNQKMLTNKIGYNYYPSWTADGKQIIFSKNRDGEEDIIYSMKADGTKPKRFLKTNSNYAKLSPKGKKVAYIAGKFQDTKIIVADIDGKNEITITP